MIFSALLCMVLSGCSENAKTPENTEVSTTVTSTQSTTSAVNKTETQTKPAETEALLETEAYTGVYYEEVTEEQAPEYCTINTGGNAYEVMVGDVVTYVFNLRTPVALEDFQVTTNYDGAMLELIEEDVSTMFPVAKSSVIYNSELMNTVKFNAVNLSGMDFTNGGRLVAFKFKVKDWGFTTIDTRIEYMDALNGDPYVSDYATLVDFEYSQEII